LDVLDREHCAGFQGPTDVIRGGRRLRDMDDPPSIGNSTVTRRMIESNWKCHILLRPASRNALRNFGMTSDHLMKNDRRRRYPNLLWPEYPFHAQPSFQGK
jgi:hypothetical protein